MSHKAVRILIEDTVRSIADKYSFSYARGTDANSQQKKYPYIRLDPLKQQINVVDNSSMSKVFNVTLVFYEKDNKENDEVNTTEILDKTDLYSDKFLAKLNFTMNEDTTEPLGSFNIEINNIRKDPFVKVLADVLSGYILQFDLTVPDQFDYCSIYA